MKNDHLYALVLAGGVGSRFWPLSRQLEPKQFHCVTGKRTLIQETLWRIKNKIRPERIFLITNVAYLFDIKKQISHFKIPSENILLEPEGKNTAPAIGWAAKHINSLDSEAVMVVLSSDHLILKPQKFLKILDKATVVARNNYLVTLGIKPTRPDTGYGYLKISSKNLKLKYYPVEKFLEKPNEQKAREYFGDKNFLWNSGIFIWKAAIILREIKKHLPLLYASINRINKENIKKVWEEIKPISIDYGVMEKSKRVVTIPADIEWTDLGSWQSLSQALKKDNDGNVIKADCINIDSKNIFVMGSERLITTIGLEDLVLVDTPDALLVCRKDLSQRVKEIVDLLKKNKRQEHILHKTVKRPWGSYTVLDVNRGFSAKGGLASGWKIKLVEIEPGERLSLQFHRKRAEHWVVVEGVAEVQKGKILRLVHANESIYIPANKPHRLKNPLKVALKIVEVQTGKYLEEDDIVRIKDDYERHKP